MSADNLQGQYISSTFRRLLQLSDSGSFVTNGTGSIVSSLPLTSSWAYTASYALNVPTIDTSSLVTTSSFNSFTGSFNSFTGSYKQDSSSFAGRIDGLVQTSSFNLLADSFNSLSGSFNYFTGSINTFTGSYNTGSFSGSFYGNVIGTATSSSYSAFNPYIVTVGTRIYTENTYITAGSKGYKHIGYNANIIKARTIANTNGNIDINVKRNGTTLGTISLSNQSSSLDTTLTGWTKQLNTDDLIEFYVSQSSVYITDISIFIDIQARQ